MIEITVRSRRVTRGRTIDLPYFIADPTKRVTQSVTLVCYGRAMPVYHFTFHAYGTWLPDRAEGYTPYRSGWKPPDTKRADQYRDQMDQAVSRFDTPSQRHALETLLRGQPLQSDELYVFAADDSHLHAVIAWRDNREPTRVQSQVKSSLIRALNEGRSKRKWLARGAGKTPVVDEEHLHHLAHVYLPSHSGVYWRRLVNGKGD